VRAWANERVWSEVWGWGVLAWVCACMWVCMCAWVFARVFAWAEALAEVQTRAQANAQAEARKESFARYRQAAVQRRETRERESRELALAEAQEWAEVKARMEARIRSRNSVSAAWLDAGVEVNARAETEPQAQMRAQALKRALDGTTRRFPPREAIVTYHEVLADSKIKGIIDSVNPRDRGLLAHNLWRHSEHWWLIQIIAPITRLPPELLQSILSVIIDDTRNSPLTLMLVSKHWYTIVTGIWGSFKLGTRTSRSAVRRKLRRNQWLLEIVVDTEIDRSDSTPPEGAYKGIFAAIEATSRWRSLVVETFPCQTDLPEHLVNRGLQRCSSATMSRLETFKMNRPCEMSPLLDRLLRILGTTAGAALTTVEIRSANVISFLLPAYSPSFRSVKVLFLDASGMHDPVDLLPHLHQLETLTASHLSLPIYAHDINLPFVNTLRHLTLRAVSIQWMSGRTFDVLESCTISSPLHHHILPVFSTALPNCKHLTFQGYPIDILDGVSAHRLIRLSVTSSGPFNRQGARQLVWLSSRILGESRLAPRILYISIEATSQAWMNALTFMPHLEELVISNARPSSLRAKVLQSLIARPVHTNNLSAMSDTGEWVSPLCPLLRRFGLKYRRWLRTSEHFDLIPDFLSIISSRTHSNYSLQSFRVWTRSDQEDSWELVEKSQIAPRGFQRLANESGINEGDVLELVLRG